MATTKPRPLVDTLAVQTRLEALNVVIRALGTLSAVDIRAVLEAAAIFYDVTVNVASNKQN